MMKSLDKCHRRRDAERLPRAAIVGWIDDAKEAQQPIR